MRGCSVSCYFRPGGGGKVTVGTVTLTVVTGVETVTGGGGGGRGGTVGTGGAVLATPPTVFATVVDAGAAWPGPGAAAAAGSPATGTVAERRSFVGALRSRPDFAAPGFA